jgi:hypothetical protein
MDGDALAQLDRFLAEYSDHVRSLSYAVLGVVDTRLAGAVRMVYENWNATVIGYSPDGKSRHAVCSVAAYRRWVNLSFFFGPHLPDPHGLLRGSGSTVRSVRIEQLTDLDERVNDLLDAAVGGWPWQFDSRRPTTTVIVAVSGRKRPRR